MLTATVLWFFLVQMPGDTSWMRVGTFESRGECEDYRINFIVTHPHFEAQPCQREWTTP